VEADAVAGITIPLRAAGGLTHLRLRARLIGLVLRVVAQA